MEKGHYPNQAIISIQAQIEQLEGTFSRVWGILSPSPERDAALYFILKAKMELRKVITQNEEE